MVAQQVAFGIMAAITIVAALRVVTTSNVVHAALSLVIVFAGIAGQMILLGAEFTASVQVLVYIGAIVVLFLFGIMLTRARIGPDGHAPRSQRLVAGLVALLLAVILGGALWDQWGDDRLPTESVQRTAEVSDAIFSTYLLPFEVVSVLLLAALIGAIVVARRD
jgi:NADH-quinone oxidoreductase subunit J